jgi:hypothetical protein
MRVEYRVFWAQKRGCSPDEYEDAFSPKEPFTGEVERFRCSVCDGATETSFSGLWADILAQAYVAENNNLSEHRASWSKTLAGKELPWYAEQKVAMGAFAAVTGLDICEKVTKSGVRQIRWSARSLGDCCVFQVRGRYLLKGTPLNDWRKFNNSPILISSLPGNDSDLSSHFVEMEEKCRRGDIFYLLSDAISRWFLRVDQEQENAIDLLERIADQEDFDRFVSEQRAIKDKEGTPLMPNDDVTFARVRVS